MSDTPETDAAWAAWQYAGPAVHVNFARKLERERAELREEMESEKRWAAQYKQERDKWADTAAKYSLEREHNACYAKQMEAERDELRAELERAEAKTAAEYEAHGMTKCERDALKSEVGRLETLYEAMKREKDDYRAQRDNIRLEADQLSTELHLERFSLKEMNAEIERLKADKARMDWLADLDCDSPLWDALSDTTKLRSTIDAAMKGAE